MKTKQGVVAALVLALAILACQAPALPAAQPSANQPVESLEPIAPAPENAEDIEAEEETLVALYDHVSPGTVAIITDQGQGSGFVYDGEGHIVTNYHVIEGASSVEVRFTSGFMAYG